MANINIEKVGYLSYDETIVTSTLPCAFIINITDDHPSGYEAFKILCNSSQIVMHYDRDSNYFSVEMNSINIYQYNPNDKINGQVATDARNAFDLFFQVLNVI